MKKREKSISVLAMILFTILFFLSVNVLGGESYTPAPPDKNKTLPANDGGPDGCNSSRFKCVMGGKAVLDKQTGLTWARNVDLAAGTKTWQEAMEFCQNLEIGNLKGWRLPTKGELINILDTSKSGPALPDGHPFENFRGSEKCDYWTSTTYEGNSNSAYYICIRSGMVLDELKLFDYRIWPVLGGN